MNLNLPGIRCPVLAAQPPTLQPSFDDVKRVQQQHRHRARSTARHHVGPAGHQAAPASSVQGARHVQPWGALCLHCTCGAASCPAARVAPRSAAPCGGGRPLAPRLPQPTILTCPSSSEPAGGRPSGGLTAVLGLALTGARLSDAMQQTGGPVRRVAGCAWLGWSRQGEARVWCLV